MFLNFGFNVGVRGGHHRHSNTVEAAELLQECIHFFGPPCIYEFWSCVLARDIIKNSGHLSTVCKISIFMYYLKTSVWYRIKTTLPSSLCTALYVSPMW